jgi:hypothetical protein
MKTAPTCSEPLMVRNIPHHSCSAAFSRAGKKERPSISILLILSHLPLSEIFAAEKLTKILIKSGITTKMFL